MRWSIRTGLVAAGLAVLAAAAGADIRAAGGELRVNQRNDYQQKNPATAFAAAGGSVVAWENDQRGIRVQLYKAGGAPLGGEIALVANPPLPALPFNGKILNRREPAVAFLRNGELLVAWTEEFSALNATHFIEDRRIEEQDVLVQRFSVAGVPLGERFQLNAGRAGLQHSARLISRQGGFLAVWEDGVSGGIVGRALDASGRPQGSEILVSERQGQRPALVANGKGTILVVWEGADENQTGVFGRLLDPAGAPIGSALRINSTTADRQGRPAVAADRAGNFFVAWQGEHPEMWAGFFYLYGQAVGANGALVGPQVRLYSGSVGSGSPQIAPAIAATPSGHFALTWIGWRNDRINLAALELDALGAPVGEAFWVTERQIRPTFRRIALSVDAAGKLLVSWESADRHPAIGARRLSVR